MKSRKKPVKKLVIDPTTVNSEESEGKLERSLQIIEAYNTLSHPSKRIDYDVKLRFFSAFTCGSKNALE